MIQKALAFDSVSCYIMVCIVACLGCDEDLLFNNFVEYLDRKRRNTS